MRHEASGLEYWFGLRGRRHRSAGASNPRGCRAAHKHVGLKDGDLAREGAGDVGARSWPELTSDFASRVPGAGRRTRSARICACPVEVCCLRRRRPLGSRPRAELRALIAATPRRPRLGTAGVRPTQSTATRPGRAAARRPAAPIPPTAGATPPPRRSGLRPRVRAGRSARVRSTDGSQARRR